MSFGAAVRHELAERPPAKACCRAAFMSGLIRTAGTLQMRSGGELAVRIDPIDATAARTLFTLLRPANAGIEIVSYREPRFARRNVVSVRLHGPRSLQLLHELGVLAEGLTPLPEPPRRLVNRRCCRGAYLRGAFVATGSVSAPRAAGHLEWRTADIDGANALAAIAAPDELVVRTAERRDHAIAYAKSKATIRELLVHMGAHDAALSYEEAEVMSATRNRANRNTNWDEANLGRMSEASRNQRHAIEQLDLDTLDPRLQEVARLRLRHAHLSLAELGKQAHPPLSKSAVARRMRTIMSLGC